MFFIQIKPPKIGNSFGYPKKKGKIKMLVKCGILIVLETSISLMVFLFVFSFGVV